jgi:hypothetical protein
MDRRTSLKLLALGPLPLAAGCTWSTDDAERAQEQAAAARAAGDTTRQFFTDHEFETVRVLSDLILPADDRSGSASEVGVPEFMDFMMTDRPSMQVPFRGGLSWLDVHTRSRFGRTFVEATDEQRRSVLDEIAYPEDAAPEVQHGVAFFNRFRDLTASGFWSSREGMEDLRYLGNRAISRWEGAPQAEMDRLGLTFDDWETV